MTLGCPHCWHATVTHACLWRTGILGIAVAGSAPEQPLARATPKVAPGGRTSWFSAATVSLKGEFLGTVMRIPSRHERAALDCILMLLSLHCLVGSFGRDALGSCANNDEHDFQRRIAKCANFWSRTVRDLPLMSSGCASWWAYSGEISGLEDDMI